MPFVSLRMLAPPRKGDRKGLSKARFRVLNMNKEEMLENFYGTLAYYMSCAVKDETLKREYQLKAVGAINVMNRVNLIGHKTFQFLTRLAVEDPKALFRYANERCGGWYEL